MSGLEHLFLGFQVAVTPFNLVMAVVGIVLGTVPGMTFSRLARGPSTRGMEPSSPWV